MIASAREKGLVLSVNHSGRMDPVVLQALEMIHNGACGQVQAVDFFRSSDYPAYRGGPSIPPQFRNGSYPFQDLGVHGLYLLEAFLGPSAAPILATTPAAWAIPTWYSMSGERW